MAVAGITKNCRGTAAGGRAAVAIEWERITVMAGIKEGAAGFFSGRLTLHGGV